MQNIKKIIEEAKKIHLIGIGGVGMSGLAILLLAKKYEVSGTDLVSSAYTEKLISKGAKIFIGKQDKLPVETEIVVVSTAISNDNPQIIDAQNKGVLTIHRSQLLNYFLENKESIGVTGMHGKTTTSSILAYLIKSVELNPSFIVGGTLLNYNTNAESGKSKFIIAEVDESDKSLLNLKLKNIILTNLEEEHLDHYKDIEDIKNVFVDFIKSIPNDGLIIYNADDDYLPQLVKNSKAKKISIALIQDAELQARNISHHSDGSSFDLYIKETFYASFCSPLIGNKNIYNLISAFAYIYALGIDLIDLTAILPKFKGTARRCEIVFKDENYLIIDDYAHHPTEVKALIDILRAKKENDVEIVVVFQPHRYSRVLNFAEEFVKSFEGIDYLFLTDIHTAGESPINGITHKTLYEIVESRSKDIKQVEYVSQDKLVSTLLEVIPQKAIIAFSGAGTILNMSKLFREQLKNKIHIAVPKG